MKSILEGFKSEINDQPVFCFPIRMHTLLNKAECKPCLYSWHKELKYAWTFTRWFLYGSYITFIRPVIYQDYSWFQDFLQISLCLKIFLKEEEVAIKERKNMGMWRVYNPPKWNIQEVQGALSSRPKGDPGLLPIFQDFVFFCQMYMSSFL